MAHSRTLWILLNGAITLSSCAFNRISRFLGSEFGRRLQRPRAFQVELFPLHSPLLRESLLVSFPPLSYMLKFSGFSYLISGKFLRGGGQKTARFGSADTRPLRLTTIGSQRTLSIPQFVSSSKTGHGGFEYPTRGTYHTALHCHPKEWVGQLHQGL